MFADTEKKVEYLKRIKFGDIELDTALKPGEIRELTETEIKLLTEENMDKNKDAEKKNKSFYVACVICGIAVIAAGFVVANSLSVRNNANY